MLCWPPTMLLTGLVDLTSGFTAFILTKLGIVEELQLRINWSRLEWKGGWYRG